jgi:lysophospholipase L1-like esterase
MRDGVARPGVALVPMSNAGWNATGARMSSPPRKLILPRKLIVFLLASYALLLAAELVARAAEVGPFALYDQSPYDRSDVFPYVHRRNVAVAWDGSFYATNSHGWRGQEREPTFAPDELRVAAIGDSCTFGKGVEDGETWPSQLERVLQQRLGGSRKAFVVNLGVNGYSGKDYLEVLRRQAVDLRPHVVIIGYNVNDFPNAVKAADAKVFQNKTNLRARIPYELRNQLSRLASFRWARARYYEFHRDRDLERVESVGRSLEPASSPALAEEAERLRQFREECASIGALGITFLFPYESQVAFDSFTRAPIDALRGVVDPLGIPFVEMVEPFRERARGSEPAKRLFLRGDRYHPNAEGYEIVANALADVILESGRERVER